MAENIKFVVLYRDHDYPFLETADEIAKGLEFAYHCSEDVLEWVKWLDPTTRQLYDVRICNSDASIQRDDRDGAPVFEHRELAFVVHENQVVATAHYSLNLDA